MSVAVLCPGQGKSVELSQLDIVKTSIASYQILTETGVVPRMFAGLSLGEFTALCCAGILAYEDVLSLVAMRQELMDEACNEFPGKMVAVLGLNDTQVEEICKKIDGVWSANYLCQTQIVVSGRTDAVDGVATIARCEGARIIELQTRGAFHTPLMQSANEEFVRFLDHIVFSRPKTAFYSSVNGERVDDPVVVRGMLSKQMVAPVRWVWTIQSMIRDGSTKFIELEPSGVLGRLVQKIIGT